MEVQVIGDRVTATFPFDREVIKKVKSLGMVWDPYRKHWHMKDTVQNRALINKYVETPPEINEPEEGHRLAADRYPDYTPPGYLMQHQKIDVTRAKTQDRWLFGNDTGCHAAGTGILLADGTIKNVEDIKVGDCVMGYDGTPMEVSKLCHGFDAMYRIIPVKGDPFTVNQEHILTLKTSPRKKGDKREIIDICLTDYLKKAKRWKHWHKLVRSSAIEFAAPARNLPIDPYFLGLYLGDGHSQYGTAITTMDAEVVEEIYNQASKRSLRVRVCDEPNNKANTYFINNGPSGGRKNPLLDELRSLGLMNGCENKHIPHDYKTGTINTRLAILAGLMDSDGSVSDNGYEYTSKSQQLIIDILFVSRSLGLAAYMSPKEVSGTTYYRASISGHTNKIPCRLPHKKALPRKQIKDVLVTGFTVQELAAGEYFGFEIGGHHRYLLSDFTVTHNTGKTLVSIEIIKMKKFKTLVICPLSIIEHAWFCDLDRFGPELRKINVWLLWKKIGQKSPDRYIEELRKIDVAIINFQGFSRQKELLSAAGFHMVIVDESSFIKSHDTHITKDITKFCENMESVYLMSGTPAPNTEMEYFSQAKIIDPQIFGKSYWKFRNKYFYQAGFKYALFPDRKNEFNENLARIMSSVAKEDVLDLPGMTTTVRDVLLNPEEKRAYKEMLKDLKAQIASAEVTAANAAIKIMKLRQITSGMLFDDDGKVQIFGDSKLNELRDLLQEIGRHQVIIWSQFQPEATRIKEMLGESALIVNGTVNRNNQNEAIGLFKRGEIQYLIAHPKSMAHGHTLTNCTYEVYFSIDHSYESWKQSHDRIYRYGQKEKCSYYLLLAPKTIDEVVYSCVLGKGKVQDAVLSYVKQTKI